ncbi:MAG: hypothetical protein ACREO9_06125, partial [Lysobacterales bacterium]
MIIIGIDPGLTGAIGVLGHRGQLVSCADMPVMARGNSAVVKNQVNMSALAEILRQASAEHDRNEVHVFIERVQPMPAVIRT